MQEIDAATHATLYDEPVFNPKKTTTYLPWQRHPWDIAKRTLGCTAQLEPIYQTTSATATTLHVRCIHTTNKQNHTNTRAREHSFNGGGDAGRLVG